MLGSTLPAEVVHAMDQVVRDVGWAVGSWHRDLSGAEGMIVNNAANDLLLLIGQVQSGDGRSAARSARAMFEHLVNLCEVAGNPVKGDRFEAHRHVTAVRIAERGVGVDRLSGGQRRRARSRMDRLRRSHTGPLAAALTKYGKSFKNQWGAQSLFESARAAGLDGAYESYRILSAVTHGSSGGLMGVRRETSAGVCHRLGPDLLLTPFAFHEGLTWWRELAVRLPRVCDETGSPLPLARNIEQALSWYPTLHAACEHLDNQMWPVQPAANMAIAVLAVYPNGRHAWLELDNRDALVRRADLVSLNAAGVAEIQEGRGRSETPSSVSRPWVFPVPSAKVQPRPGRGVPAHQVLWSPTVADESESPQALIPLVSLGLVGALGPSAWNAMPPRWMTRSGDASVTRLVCGVPTMWSAPQDGGPCRTGQCVAGCQEPSAIAAAGARRARWKACDFAYPETSAPS